MVGMFACEMTKMTKMTKVMHEVSVELMLAAAVVARR